MSVRYVLYLRLLVLGPRSCTILRSVVVFFEDLDRCSAYVTYTSTKGVSDALLAHLHQRRSKGNIKKNLQTAVAKDRYSRSLAYSTTRRRQRSNGQSAMQERSWRARNKAKLRSTVHQKKVLPEAWSKQLRQSETQRCGLWLPWRRHPPCNVQMCRDGPRQSHTVCRAYGTSLNRNTLANPPGGVAGLA